MRLSRLELILGIFALVLVGGLVGYCNHHPKPIEVPALPVKADTIVVADSAGRVMLAKQIEELEKEIRALAKKQPKQNLIEKHYITQPIVVEKPDAVWGVRTLKVGGQRGDTTTASSQRYISAGDTLLTQQSVTSYYTPGPLTGLYTDTSGVHPTFGEYVPPSSPCGFACKSKYAGIGIGVGVVLHELLVK